MMSCPRRWQPRTRQPSPQPLGLMAALGLLSMLDDDDDDHDDDGDYHDDDDD